MLLIPIISHTKNGIININPDSKVPYIITLFSE